MYDVDCVIISIGIIVLTWVLFNNNVRGSQGVGGGREGLGGAQENREVTARDAAICLTTGNKIYVKVTIRSLICNTWLSRLQTFLYPSGP